LSVATCRLIYRRFQPYSSMIFLVWRAYFDASDQPISDSLKIPTHYDLGRMYLDLRYRNAVLRDHLINVTLAFI